MQIMLMFRPLVAIKITLLPRWLLLRQRWWNLFLFLHLLEFKLNFAGSLQRGARVERGEYSWRTVSWYWRWCPCSAPCASRSQFTLIHAIPHDTIVICRRETLGHSVLGLEMAERWTERFKGSRCFAQIISKYSKFETYNRIIPLPLNNEEIPSFPPHCNHQSSFPRLPETRVRGTRRRWWRSRRARLSHRWWTMAR